MEKEQPIEESVREVMNDIARMIGGALAEATQNSREQYGFALLMFGLSGNEECRMSYIASVNRQAHAVHHLRLAIRDAQIGDTQERFGAHVHVR